MSKPYTEYRVVEKANQGFYWYPHGGTFYSRGQAEESLERMRAYYGEYGRIFGIETRTISDWEHDDSYGQAT